MYHTGPRYAEVVAFRGCPSSKAKRASEGGERDQEHDQSERSEHCENKERQGEDKKRGRGYDNDEGQRNLGKGARRSTKQPQFQIPTQHNSTNYFTSESVLSSRPTRCSYDFRNGVGYLLDDCRIFSITF